MASPLLLEQLPGDVLLLLLPLEGHVLLELLLLPVVLEGEHLVVLLAPRLLAELALEARRELLQLDLPLLLDPADGLVGLAVAFLLELAVEEVLLLTVELLEPDLLLSVLEKARIDKS